MRLTSVPIATRLGEVPRHPTGDRVPRNGKKRMNYERILWINRTFAVVWFARDSLIRRVGALDTPHVVGNDPAGPVPPLAAASPGRAAGHVPIAEVENVRVRDAGRVRIPWLFPLNTRPRADLRSTLTLRVLREIGQA